jgi:hypothetical protein
MKRLFILITVVLFTVGTAFADEAVLIDFAKLAADIHVDDGSEGDAPNQNRQTLMDYSGTAGGSFTPEQKGLMKTSLALANWDVELASSSRNVGNTRQSYTSPAPSKQYETVLGVRVHFPVEPFGSWALIKPPFEIPSNERSSVSDDGTIGPAEDPAAPSRFEGPAGDDGTPEHGYGVVTNVGSIKSVAVDVYGLNFPHSLSTILIDDKGNKKTIFMGYLGFDGWGELRWENPAYVQEVRNRELRIYPLYPEAAPFVKFGGFLIQRDAAAPGGDYIGYFRDVKVIYDKATLDTDKDIDDEAIWGINRTREDDKAKYEMQQFGQSQVLRYLESQKLATEPPFGDPSREQTE